MTAVYGAIEVAGAVGGTVLGAALGPLGFAVGLAAVSGLSYSEGQKLRALYECVKGCSLTASTNWTYSSRFSTS